MVKNFAALRRLSRQTLVCSLPGGPARVEAAVLLARVQRLSHALLHVGLMAVLLGKGLRPAAIKCRALVSEALPFGAGRLMCHSDWHAWFEIDLPS